MNAEHRISNVEVGGISTFGMDVQNRSQFAIARSNYLMNLQRILFVVCYWLLSISLQAQTISGKVIDAKTLEPLPFANVFINNTTIGTTSEMNGEFKLKNVRQPAVYEVIFSFVGYESFKMKVSLSENELKIGTIRLTPAKVELSSLEVTGTKDTQWEKKLKKFKRIFLGEDAAADLCMIVNPWVIDFPEGVKKFKAVASAPIEIENKALGYKVTFYLANFLADNVSYLIEGNVRFEELKSNDQKEMSKWAIERNKSFQHSRQHLFKSMIDHRIKGNGFNLYTDIDITMAETAITRSAFFFSELGKTVVPFDTIDLVTPTKQKDIYKIALKGRLEVHYRKEKVLVRTYRDVFNPVSWIRLNKNYVLVNKNGVELNPVDVTISGAMNAERVAHLLPLNYLPDEMLIEEQKQDLLPFLEERIYVQTDKPYYYPGESIWFKGYVNYRAPSLRDSLSQTVYVELLERQKKTIKQSKTLRIDSGLFHGDFLLPDTLASGSYYLRAYTNLNRNFGDNKLFVKQIPVLNLLDKVKADQSVDGVKQDTLFTIVPDKRKYQTREKITLTLRLRDDDELPLASNISLSVTDASQVVPIEISSSILDSYPLKENQVNSGKKSLFHPIEYGISFTGRFYNDNKQPEKALLNVFQLNPRNFTMTQSDEKGLFSVSGFSFYDTAAFSIQSLSGKGEAYGKVELLKRETPPMEFNEISYRIDLVKTESPQRIRFELSKDAKMLKEVEIKASRIVEEFTTEYRTKRPYGKPNYVLKTKDINASYGNLLYTLPGKFPGLVVRQADNPEAGGSTGPKWVVYILRAATGSINFPKEVLVTVNDAIVGGAPGDILGTIDPATVESIELKTGVNVLFGALGFSGVLAIYTKKGTSEEEVKIKKDIPVIKVPGYSKPGRFSFPDYEDPKTNSSTTDYRSLLYWNPEIITDQKTGTATVSFFASDLPGRYRIVAEGVTQNGKPVRCVTFVEVASP